MSRSSPRVVHLGLGLVVTSAIFAAAWFASAASHSYALVSVQDMLTRFRQVWLFGHFSSDAVPSVVRMLVGLAIATVVGIALGVAIGLSRAVRAFCEPVMAFLRSIPPVALLPAAIVVLGIGDTMRITVIAFVCLWPVVLNTADGVAEIDGTMTATARAYGLRGLDRLRFLLLPAAAPRAFAGLRTALNFALLLMITSELIASTNGIGSYMVAAQQAFRTADMWSAIILLGLLGILLNALLTVVERRLVHWENRAAT